jgi:FkbH-like protein
MKFSDILKNNIELGNSLSGDDFKIAVLSNVIINQLNPILEYYVRKEGVFAKCESGNYDNIVQEAEKYKEKDLVLIVWELSNLIDGLQYRADLLSEKETDDLIIRFKNEINHVFLELNKTSSIIVTKFSTIIFNHHLIKKNNFDKICDELNEYLVKTIPINCLLIDVDKIFSKISVLKSVDFRNYYSSKSLYTVDFYCELSKMISPFIFSIKGKVKKALILDCDNTLWKGIVGEDGPEGIKMSSKDSNGVVFEEIQYLIKSLSRKGVIIGINSKNNAEDVLNIFNNHKEMILLTSDLSIQKINWKDKVTNLQEISNELNIGIDSIVFMDDSDFEINLVEQYLTSIKSIQVPKHIYLYPDYFRQNINLFFNNTILKEDINRQQMYQEQVLRDHKKNQFENIQDYIKSLELNMSFYIDNYKIVSRIAQLTQKTNQFNLTTIRYTENDISVLIEDPNSLVYAFGLKDKYGDFGITGVSIVKLFGEKAYFDSMLMSCRVLGRNIEKKFIQLILEHLKSIKVIEVNATYIKTQKNMQVENLYNQIGFTEISNFDTTKNYKGFLNDLLNNDLKYINVTYEK